jgi:hypothetical protein
VVYLKCTKAESSKCIPAPIPRRIWHNPDGVVVKGRLQDGSTGEGAGLGMSSDGRFGDAYVLAGHWIFSAPLLERQDCAPRPSFEIKVKMFYEIIFRFGRPGQCSATVWEQPLGLQHPEQRHVVARAGAS